MQAEPGEEIVAAEVAEDNVTERAVEGGEVECDEMVGALNGVKPNALLEDGASSSQGIGAREGCAREDGESPRSWTVFWASSTTIFLSPKATSPRRHVTVLIPVAGQQREEVGKGQPTLHVEVALAFSARRRLASSGWQSRTGGPMRGGDAFLRLPCALLVEFLDLREAVNLLNASRWLRADRVLTATALEKTRYAQHFHQKCAADWWHLTPAWRAGAGGDWDDDEDEGDDDAADARADAEAPDVWADCHVRTAAGKELTYWRDTVRDTPQWQHVPLLSIIDFMVSKLLPQSYISFKYAATVYTARPVIIRLHPPGGGRGKRQDGQDAAEQDAARRISDALAAQNGTLTSLFGLHWENMHVDTDTGNVSCAVCQLYADEVHKYQTKVAQMVSDWKEAVKRELPGWKEQGMHQMEIDRRTYEMREEMIPYSGYYTSNVARRHGDIIIRHICSYWTTLDHLKINTLGYRDASQLVAALTSDIRKQCQHFSKIKQAMTNAFPRVARIRYKVDEPEPSPSTNLWQHEAVTELVAGLEVVAGRRERQRHGLLVRGPEPPAHDERHHEHEEEVDEQRHGGVDDLVQVRQDARALRGEEHDDREEQRKQREHANARRELVEVPGVALGLGQRAPREQRRHEGRAHVDADVLGDFAHGDVDVGARVDAEVAREVVDKEPCVGRVEPDGEHGVHGHDGGAVLCVPAGERVPDHDHGDAARAAHEAEPGHVADVVAEEGRREQEHDEGPEHPVLRRRKQQQAPAGEDAVHEVPAHARERRVHHDEQPHGHEHVGAAHGGVVDEALDGADLAEPEAGARGQHDPERQQAVQQRESAHDAPARGGGAVGQRLLQLRVRHGGGAGRMRVGARDWSGVRGAWQHGD
ncbi:unnamed protein product [Phytophthora fragariaefolia]|uniref:Unnamed protein product n=1 Tax=Phytophthora fragariaefolia TaxID=1490495 RepID=A0A9W6YFS9_9STRA|nr:unnamed protein product [Phytophthora fragariaefolia]